MPSIGGDILRGVIEGRRDTGNRSADREYKTLIQLCCVAGGVMASTAWMVISKGD